MQSPIFYNENINIGGSHIFYNTWYKKGIRFLNDLINERSEFYTHDEFKERTGINSNTLQYHGTIKAIKVYLKEIKLNISHKMNSPFIPSHILPFIKQAKGSKIMYDILNQNKDIPTGQLSWNKLYAFTQEDWVQIYKYPFTITKYPALLWFQVSVNHNILVTNKLLYQMKIRNDALCTFCKLNNETITPLLWKCEQTQQFIKKLMEWLKTYDNIYNISEEFFIFGRQKEQVLPKAIKFILLYAKYFIYVPRCKQRSLSPNIFKTQLKFMHKVHLHIVSNHNDVAKFQDEWSLYQELISDIV